MRAVKLPFAENAFQIPLTHNLTVVPVITRILLAIEIVVLGLLAILFTAVTVLAATGVNTVRAALYFAACLLLCLAAVATMELARRVRARVVSTGADLLLYGLIAISGAVVATSVTVYGLLFLSPVAMWARGFTSLAYGCLLWIPIVHLSVLVERGRRFGS